MRRLLFEPRAAAPLALLALSGCALATLATKGRSLPDDDGEITVVGPDAPIVITRDEHDIPHIRAQSADDAEFGLGFVHARDRLFQADAVRRIAYGRLSEWLGEDAADLDGFTAGLQLEALAARDISRMSADQKKTLDAYVAGFNEGVRSLKALPVEYRLLHADFEPWTPQDVLALVYVEALFLSENPQSELTALALRDKVDAAGLDALLRGDAASPPVDGYWDTLRTAKIGKLTTGFDAFWGTLGSGVPGRGSNDWVIGGERSADGKPIVANDPHLVQTVPSLWYVADVQGGDVHMAGATMSGAPGVILGHNERVAWGWTNVMADSMDLAVLERDGDDGYVLGGQKKKLEKRTSTVHVKGAKDVTATTWWTEIGPVITDLEGDHLVAWRWDALEIPDDTMGIVDGLDRATSVEDALAAVKRPSVIAQNLVVADVSGDYAWQSFGSVVRRRGYTGRVPYPASSADYDWAGWVDPMPGDRHPTGGFVATANNRPASADADAISTHYVDDARYRRIGELARARTDHTVGSVGAMQLDRVDLQAKDEIPRLLDGVTASTEPARTCRELLLNWDGETGPESTGAAVYYPFEKELLRIALEDDLGKDGLEAYLAYASPGDSILDDPQRLGRFLPDRAKGVDEALDHTCAYLKETLGPETPTWGWGRLHQLALHHPMSSASALLRGWDMQRVPYGGSGNTVNAAGVSFLGDEWGVGAMASVRLVTPMSDPSKGTVIYPGGQSGQPASRWYRDLYDPWLAGETVPLWFADADVKAHAERTLTLDPGQRGYGTVQVATPVE